MKLIKCITFVLIITAAAVVTDCSKESDKDVIPGYWSPGVFRPKGIAREKAFRLGDSKIETGKSCGPDTSCMAVYSLWLTGLTLNESYPSEGIALDDSYLDSTNLGRKHVVMKMSRYSGGPWSIQLYLNGKKYVNNSVTDIVLTTCQSIDETTPAYTDPDGNILPSSGIFLQLVFVRFTNNIDLTSTDGGVTDIITINQTDPGFDTSSLPGSIPSGDFILAQRYI